MYTGATEQGVDRNGAASGGKSTLLLCFLSAKRRQTISPELSSVCTPPPSRFAFSA